jgi:hypothetical protein
MKKTIVTLITAFIISIFATSCYHAGETYDSDVTLKMGNKEYKIKQVFIDNNDNYIYVVYPKDSTFALPVQTTMRRDDDPKRTTVILD